MNKVIIDRFCPCYQQRQTRLYPTAQSTVLPGAIATAQLYEVVKNPKEQPLNDYFKPGKQLYQWLFAPLVKALQEQKIDNVSFVLPAHTFQEFPGIACSICSTTCIIA
ncbi:hypothetical protein [Pantanalinema sp. GBBB05]|uniref:hypothetical protein n=1 Tax=Pantanalinema sp. GBBB05 TaxID=2604139 RepID=UPI001D468D71|nr:hypothetical protein [Pantanalinema sp. GBBB05]